MKHRTKPLLDTDRYSNEHGDINKEHGMYYEMYSTPLDSKHGQKCL